MLLGAVLGASAQVYKSVHITLTDGSVSQIDLTDNMKTTFDELNIVFSDGDFLLEIEKVLVDKFEFKDDSGIESVTNEAPVVKSGVLTLQGMPDNSVVRIYTVAGVCVSEVKFSNTCSIDLNEFPVGIYVVNVNSVSYKIAISK